jgi:hypothetical protein
MERPARRGKIRPPLGDFYEGECHARPAEIHRPESSLQVEACNFGYAARQCGCFPDADGPEAVRFCVREDTGSEVRIDYVLERKHLPFAHGSVIYERRGKTWAGVLPPRSLLQRQAQAYLESYLRWKEGDPDDAKPPVEQSSSAAAGGKQ